MEKVFDVSIKQYHTELQTCKGHLAKLVMENLVLTNDLENQSEKCEKILRDAVEKTRKVCEENNKRSADARLKKQAEASREREEKAIYSTTQYMNSKIVEKQKQIDELQKQLIDARSIAAELQKKIEDENCVICFERTKQVVFLPCKHRVACETCVEEMIPKQHPPPRNDWIKKPVVLFNCPMCRAGVETHFKC